MCMSLMGHLVTPFLAVLYPFALGSTLKKSSHPGFTPGRQILSAGGWG